MAKTIMEQLAAQQLKQIEMRTAAEQAAARLRRQRGQVRGKAPKPPLRPARLKAPPKTFDAALRGMVDRPFLESQRYQEQQWRANREGAHWHILDFERLFIKACAKMGIPMFAHSVVRTAAEQTELFVRGVTRAQAGQSDHNFGLATDIVHSVKAWDLSENEWLLLRHIGMEVALRNGLKVQWGGDWKYYDPAHWALLDDARDGFPYPKRPSAREQRWASLKK